ncbi:MAG: polymer-forming cytoskeletal protein [bacterium]|nr:polymer-forming cytoskeletal protein [bacterium]
MNLKKEREPAANSGEINAFLGKGTDFNGKLTFEGTVRLDGKFSGEIFSPGILIIGETATVDANINVNTLIVSGKLTGNIDAKARVEIHAPGKLYGNINSPVLVIDEGVIFEGSCTMETKDSNKVSILERKEEDVAAKS